MRSGGQSNLRPEKRDPVNRIPLLCIAETGNEQSDPESVHHLVELPGKL